MSIKEVSTKEKIIRASLHFPVGILNVLCFGLGILLYLVFGSPWLILIGITIGILFFLGFYIYELTEDIFHLKDGAYIDIIGHLIGFGFGTSVAIVGCILWIITTS